VEIDDETTNFFLTAEASKLSYVFKHLNSLRLLRSIEEDTSNSAKIKPLSAGNAKEWSGKTDRKITNDDIGENDDNAAGFDVKRVKERVEEEHDDGGLDRWRRIQSGRAP
jgi:hypothetical protein